MLKILIIDDDALTRKGIQTLMPWNAHNMEIIGEASNGKNALEFLADHDVDLVLVDLDMPIMDGMTFIEQAKSFLYLKNLQIGQSVLPISPIRKKHFP